MERKTFRRLLCCGTVRWTGGSGYRRGCRCCQRGSVSAAATAGRAVPAAAAAADVGTASVAADVGTAAADVGTAAADVGTAAAAGTGWFLHSIPTVRNRWA